MEAGDKKSRFIAAIHSNIQNFGWNSGHFKLESTKFPTVLKVSPDVGLNDGGNSLTAETGHPADLS